ncbi:hypothetical protein H4R34_005287 [Dimargaris verticillata]|uniref:Uncharacterized protein n=1 Tax=Dimargaris verticillata TaxID=2761393 RepID=A0A9W8AYH5_9FUNG|nr:hypothetical protein H4R34_005287 [Dimargaris verticillata]
MAHEISAPDLFLAYPFRNVAIPKFVRSWKLPRFHRKPISPNRIKHGLVNLGLVNSDHKPDITRIVDVVKSLFEAIGSGNLLTNFQDLAKEASKDYQASKNLALTNPSAITPGQLLSKKLHALIYRFWVEVIGGNNEKQLRYYLRNLLAFNVIPGIIGQVLGSSKSSEYDDALELARQISETPGVTRAIQDYPQNTPNYFEFIMVYAIESQLDGFYDLIPKIKATGKVDIDFLYHCFEGYVIESPWHALEITFELIPPENPRAWLHDNELACKPLLLKHTRAYGFGPAPFAVAYFPSGEDTFDWFEPDVEQHQASVQ